RRALAVPSPGQAPIVLSRPTVAAYRLNQVDDPVFLAMQRYNTQVVTQGAAASQVEPTDDTRAYPVDGAPQPMCRPFLRLQQLGPPLPSPAVGFERQDDGLHLKVTMEEDVTKRVAGALPFAVSAKSVQLKYGAAADAVLDFGTPLQEPVPPADPPGP